MSTGRDKTGARLVVIPRVLADLLRKAGPDLQRRMALAFARHVLENSRDRVEEYLAYCGYLDVAEAYLRGDATIGDVATSGVRFREVWIREAPAGNSWGPVPGLSGRVGDIVRQAVIVACQRELEVAGHVPHNRYQTHVSQIARDAQSLACEIASMPGARPRWEEARWQLLHLIEQTPNPHNE